MLSPKVQAELTEVIRAARRAHVASGNSPRERDDVLLDTAIAMIIARVRKELGVADGKSAAFVMPYQNHYPAAGIIIGRYLTNKAAFGPFFFKWTEDGLTDEPPVLQPTVWRNGIRVVKAA